MARIAKSTAENAAVNTQDSQEQPEKAVGETAETQKMAEKETFIYIGPTVKAGALRTNTTFTGTKNEIKKYLKEILEEIPQVERLLVPVKKLAESKERIRDKGTLLNKYYNEIASLNHAKREE